MENHKKELIELIDAKKDLFIAVANQVWDAVEIRFDTPKSSDAFCKLLEAEGFTIERGIANMENAFVATYGNTSPTVGILAEFDALSNLSQVADDDKPNPLVVGGNGHGCGHNLLGSASLAAAVGLKDYLQKNNVSGTIQLFGCPAEESGYGKSFMTRDGIFNHLDVALTWHPMDTTMAWSISSLAVCQAYFNFEGIAAHAAAAPEKGRSALDAAELMNVGVQFLREHVSDDVRIHYAFMDVGGTSANVVQPSASLYYFVRAKNLNTAREIFERVKKVAEGAALMTETKLNVVFDSAAANYMPNHVLTEAMQANLESYGKMDLTEEDYLYGDRYFKSLPEETKKSLYNRVANAFPDRSTQELQKLATDSYLNEVFPLQFSDATSGSTDVGDVSWVTPTAQVTVACEPQGTPPHSWQWNANGKSSPAHKGMLTAAHVIATTGLDIFLDDTLLQKTKDEFKSTFENMPYESGIPKDVIPK